MKKLRFLIQKCIKLTKKKKYGLSDAEVDSLASVLNEKYFDYLLVDLEKEYKKYQEILTLNYLSNFSNFCENIRFKRFS